jgi:5-deoxy-glucuronate isomerase
MSSPQSAYVLRSGHAAADGFDVLVTPESAGWTYSGLRVLTLTAGAARALETGHDEVVVVSLAGAATVELPGRSISLTGRADVFAGPTDLVYLPPGTRAVLQSAAGGRYALCTARTDTVLPVRYVPAADVAVQTRGAGQSSRLVRNFAMADSLPAGAILACEVITPGGNWSSYPAHKHDEPGASEAQLEEIYYFEIAAGPGGEPGIGFHRTSSSPRWRIDVVAEVGSGDLALVPGGWHGPCVAAPGFDMYYLNVMAGPGPERRWAVSDHPAQAWVRDTWADAPVDPRLLDGRYTA